MPSVPFIRMPSVPFIRMPSVPLIGVPSMLLTRTSRPLQIIKRLLIRIVPVRQFPFIKIIRWIRIAEVGVLFHILFRLIMRACNGVLLVFVFVLSHKTVFSSSHKSRAGIEKTLALPNWHRLCRPKPGGARFVHVTEAPLLWSGNEGNRKVASKSLPVARTTL
jgi:hypothetical protein